MKPSVIQRFADPTLIAFSLRAGDWPRGLISATLIPDAWMGLIERADGRRALLSAGDAPRGEPEDVLALVRNRRITVPLQISDAPAACGNLVNVRCELLLSWPARGDDLGALLHNVLSLPELTLGRLQELLAEGGGRLSLEKFVRERGAERLLAEDLRGELLGFLGKGLQRLGFDCGFVLEEVASLELTSRTYVQQQARAREADVRLERIRARETLERAAAAVTARRLDDLGGIVEKLRAVADADKSHWHSLLPSLAPGERGRLLENLWRIAAAQRRARAIVAIAGQECVWLDPQAPQEIARRATLPPDFGGLRSVTFAPGKNWLLIGAATGVWALDARDASVAGRFAARVDGAAPRTGFNAAVIGSERVFATHSQLGCRAWALGGGEQAALLAPRDGTPRTVRAPAIGDDGALYFAADDCVYRVPSGSAEPLLHTSADSTIHCLAVVDRTLIVGTEGGKLLRADLAQPDDWWVAFRTNRPIETLDIRHWDDLVEVLVPGGSQGVLSIFDEHSIIAPLLTSAHALRGAWACDDLVVALSDLRDRLIVLPASRAERNGVDVSLARMLGGTVQDVCVTWETVTPGANP